MLRLLMLRSEGFEKGRGCTILHSSALSGIYTGREKRFKS